MNYILKDENAVYYECGFSCDNEIFLSLGSEKFFITDARYTTEAREHIHNAEVVEAKDLAKAAREILKKEKIKKLIYDPGDFTCAQFEKLSKKLTLHFIPIAQFSWKKRVIKRDEEIAKIKESARLNAQAFDAFALYLQQEGLGKSERYLHFESTVYLTRHGEYDLSFDPIFALNENGAKPHAIATHKPLQRGDLVLFDAGIKYERYCSDRTRTAFFDEDFNFQKRQLFKDKAIQKAYDLVRAAQEEAIAKARSGMRAKEIDKIARDIIQKGGYGKYFVHSLGHGVGLDIHEMPFINQRNEQIIEDGMVFTIEPGIYIPGKFGIRIEDMVVMQSGRAEVL